ncbi:MAG: transketolase family protein [Candidatus Magasanikbacteria bacterium]|nr:transketolase family protein [Candidatus Magasanikbacteria bacterium]
MENHPTLTKQKQRSHNCERSADCDLSESTRSLTFQKKFPERFFEMGVAEQNMAGVAAGMAGCDKVPFISSYAVFSPGRNWDQIRVSICYSNLNVKIMGAHSGISVGPDGATHQALEDIAITRVLPNLLVLSPCDVHEARRAVLAAAEYKGPVYIRFTREKTPVITKPDAPFQIGKAYVLREGSDVTIIGTGPLVYEALLAAEQLSKKGVEAEVINCPSIKPLDEKTILKSIQKTGGAVTIEEHQISGGLFGAISEFSAMNFPVPVLPVGMPNIFGESGAPDELLTKYGMRAKNIIAQVNKILK